MAQSDDASPSVWVFNGTRPNFPSAVFSTRGKAEEWINANRIPGVLTRYPLDTVIYDWAVEQGHFVPKKPEHCTAAFISNFSTAYLEHYHFDHTQGDQATSEAGESEGE